MTLINTGSYTIPIAMIYQMFANESITNIKKQQQLFAYKCYYLSQIHGRIETKIRTLVAAENTHETKLLAEEKVQTLPKSIVTKPWLHPISRQSLPSNHSLLNASRRGSSPTLRSICRTFADRIH
jgi:hypothetical protein